MRQLYYCFLLQCFFAVEDEQLKQLVSGYQCGGSMGGDFVHLCLDREAEDFKFSVSGEFKEFGGYASSHEIYSHEKSGFDEERQKCAVWRWKMALIGIALLICWTSRQAVVLRNGIYGLTVTIIEQTK